MCACTHCPVPLPFRHSLSLLFSLLGTWQLCRGISKKWKLKLSTANTESAAFHLNFREANREMLPLRVKISAHAPNQHKLYLGVKMDWTLTFRRHLESLRRKLTLRVGLLRQLAGSSLRAATKSLRTAILILALVHSTPE